MQSIASPTPTSQYLSHTPRFGRKFPSVHPPFRSSRKLTWFKVKIDYISASALLLSSTGLKKKATYVAEPLKPGSQTEELSSAGWQRAVL